MPTQTQSLAPLPEYLNLVLWRDPVVEALGNRPSSAYMRAMFGALGPSTTLARSLGLGQGLDKDATMSRAVACMVAFGAANRTGATLGPRIAIPDVAHQQRRKVSTSTQLAHEYWAHRQPEPASVTPEPVRAEVGL